VLLDRSADGEALTVVVAYCAAGDETAVVKSDLIKTVHAAFDALTDSNQRLAGVDGARERGGWAVEENGRQHH
jgi:hypothetical protein